jgi:hypothetical protein
VAALVPGQPAPIGGAKWERELAALLLLYQWAVAQGHMERSPVTMHTVRRGGAAAEVPANRATDVRAANVKWFTPRTCRLWRDVGLRGSELLADNTDKIGYRLNDRISDVGQFIESLQRVADGGTVLDPQVVRQLLARSRKTDPLGRLTPRKRRCSRSWPKAGPTPPSPTPS